MKKLSVICTCMVILSLVAVSAFAADYRTDVLEPGNSGGWTSSLKTFDDTYKIEAGQIFEVDIWLNNAPGPANGGGVFIDFTGFTDKISYVSCERYDNGVGELPGPWLAGVGNTINEPSPYGEGALIALVGNLAAVTPDDDGDIIIARVTFECLVSGTAEITVSVVPLMPTWAPSPPWDDGKVEPIALTISPFLPPESSTTTISIDNTSTSSTTFTSSTSTSTTSTSSTSIAATTTSTESTISTTTVSTPSSICLVEEIFGENSEEVEILRFFRDSVLNKTPSGREIIKMYNEWNYRIARLAREDEELKKQLTQTFHQIFSLIRIAEE